MKFNIAPLLAVFRSPLLACMLFLPAASLAETPWYEHAFHVYGGAVDNAGTISGRDSYGPVSVPGEMEQGIGYVLLNTPTWELELALSQLKGSTVQRNESGSGNEGNALNVSIEQTFIRMIGRYRFDPWQKTFAPWIGGGVNLGKVKQEDQELVSLDGGPIRKATRTEAGTAAGVQLGAGLDIYFGETSAFALTLEGRYCLEFTAGPVDANINNAAFLVGIRWDFWPATD